MRRKPSPSPYWGLFYARLSPEEIGKRMAEAEAKRESEKPSDQEDERT